MPAWAWLWPWAAYLVGLNDESLSPYPPAPRQATVYRTELHTLPQASHAELLFTVSGNAPASSLATLQLISIPIFMIQPVQ